MSRSFLWSRTVAETVNAEGTTLLCAKVPAFVAPLPRNNARATAKVEIETERIAIRRFIAMPNEVFGNTRRLLGTTFVVLLPLRLLVLLFLLILLFVGNAPSIRTSLC